MKEITLTKNMVAIVDDEDYEKFSKWKWSFSNVGYAQRTGGVYLHRLIAGAKPGEFVDHINRDKLDNRRSNLRICNKQQNQHNQGPRKGSSSYKGVSIRKDTGKYTACIHHNYKKINLGSFVTEEEAALAYNEAARKYHGEFAFCNEVL